MLGIHSLRRQFGDNFVVQFSDGLIVPWKLLSVGDFLNYTTALQARIQPPAEIENEIFTKCVLDKSIVNTMYSLKAGIVSTVVGLIMQYSGPHGHEDLNYRLNLARTIIQQSIHQVVSLITQAFPAYIPEQIYDMDYDTLMIRLAQAEAKLVQLGIQKDPITFHSNKEEKEEKKAPQPKPDLKKEYERQTQKPKPPPPKKKEPVAAPQTEQTIITQGDILEHDSVASSHEKTDLTLSKQKMLEETMGFYEDYLKQLQEGGKFKPKTDEERKAEAEQRSEQIKQKLLEKQKEQKIQAKKEREELLKIRERERIRKSRRKRR